jgi:hypothetical protein
MAFMAAKKNQAGNAPRLTFVAHRRIEELKPDPANPRRHSKKQIRQIARSIEALGIGGTSGNQ